MQLNKTQLQKKKKTPYIWKFQNIFLNNPLVKGEVITEFFKNMLRTE